MFARSFYTGWDEEEANDRLLIGYTTGALCDALSLLTEVYTEINEQARRSLQEMQTVCGALLEEIAPIAVSDACLQKLLAGLDMDDCEECKPQKKSCTVLPTALQRYTHGACFEDLDWKHKRHGVDVARMNAPASVLRVQPGLQASRPVIGTVRFTLVLDGALMKGDEPLPRGTLYVSTPQSRTPVSSCEDKGCVFLSAQENINSMAKILNKLLASY